MADHLHLFCAPEDMRFTIEGWIGYWKRQFSRKHGNKNWKFQSRGCHHRLRDGENYSEKWLYVQENPMRKGLVQRIKDWPFKGQVFDLIWTGKQLRTTAREDARPTKFPSVPPGARAAPFRRFWHSFSAG
jgi:hypothetical protein